LTATSADGASLQATLQLQPEIDYARSGDVSIAYHVAGDGPVDLVVVSFLGNIAYLVSVSA
jgi:hypothetical protein